MNNMTNQITQVNNPGDYFTQLRQEVSKFKGYEQQLREQVAHMGQPPAMAQAPQAPQAPDNSRMGRFKQKLKGGVSTAFNMMPLGSVNARDPLATPKSDITFEAATPFIGAAKPFKGPAKAAAMKIKDSPAVKKLAKTVESEAVDNARDFVYSTLKEIVDNPDLKNIDLIDEAQNLMGDLAKKYEIHNAIRRGFEIIRLTTRHAKK